MEMHDGIGRMQCLLRRARVASTAEGRARNLIDAARSLGGRAPVGWNDEHCEPLTPREHAYLAYAMGRDDCGGARRAVAGRGLRTVREMAPVPIAGGSPCPCNADVLHCRDGCACRCYVGECGECGVLVSPDGYRLHPVRVAFADPDDPDGFRMVTSDGREFGGLRRWAAVGGARWGVFWAGVGLVRDAKSRDEAWAAARRLHADGGPNPDEERGLAVVPDDSAVSGTDDSGAWRLVEEDGVRSGGWWYRLGDTYTVVMEPHGQRLRVVNAHGRHAPTTDAWVSLAETIARNAGRSLQMKRGRRGARALRALRSEVAHPEARSGRVLFPHVAAVFHGWPSRVTAHSARPETCDCPPASVCIGCGRVARECGDGETEPCAERRAGIVGGA